MFASQVLCLKSEVFLCEVDLGKFHKISLFISKIGDSDVICIAWKFHWKNNIIFLIKKSELISTFIFYYPTVLQLPDPKMCLRLVPPSPKEWCSPSPLCSGTSSWPRLSTAKTRRTNQRSSASWRHVPATNTSKTWRRTIPAPRRWTPQEQSSASSPSAPKGRNVAVRGSTLICTARGPSRGRWLPGTTASLPILVVCWPSLESLWRSSRRLPRKWFLTVIAGTWLAGARRPRRAGWSSFMSVATAWCFPCRTDAQRKCERSRSD